MNLNEIKKALGAKIQAPSKAPQINQSSQIPGDWSSALGGACGGSIVPYNQQDYAAMMAQMQAQQQAMREQQLQYKIDRLEQRIAEMEEKFRKECEATVFQIALCELKERTAGAEPSPMQQAV